MVGLEARLRGVVVSLHGHDFLKFRDFRPCQILAISFCDPGIKMRKYVQTLLQIG